MKKILLSVFVLLVLFVAGCDFGAICGDGVCDPSEDWLNNCPQDCNLVPVPECRVNVDCDDDSDYTVDLCDDGYCYHEVLDCLYDSDCDDDNGETRDYCEDNECHHELSLPTSVLELATLKNNYLVGEIIRLTDPPANIKTEELKNPYEMSFSNGVRPASNLYGLTPGVYTNKETGQQVLVEKYLPSSFDDATKTNVASAQQTNKYIVKLKQKPALEEYADLNTEISKKQIELETAKTLSLITGNSILQKEQEINVLKEQLYSKVSKQLALIESEHIVAKTYLSRKVSDFDRKVEKEFTKTFNGLVVEMTENEAEEVRKSPLVEEVYPDYEVKALLMDSVPLIGANLAWDLDYTGEGVTIAIIDTGIDYTHPDLGGCLGDNCKVLGGYDFINDDADPMDDNGHGTHCAATAASSGVLKGVAPDAKLYGYKVLSSSGSGSFSTVLAGMERAVDPNQDGNFDDRADVISMSLGGYGNPDDPLNQAADAAVDAGSVMVIAAGNSGSGSNTIGSPGTSRKAITVGASFKKNYELLQIDCVLGEYTNCGLCDENGFVNCSYWGSKNPVVDEITSFSSRGPVIWDGGMIVKPDIIAPGALICAARYDSIFPHGEHPFYHPCYDEEHVQLAGTSMATPQIAGVAALIKQAHPDWTPQEIKQVMKNTAIDLGEDINTQGSGRIDVFAAIQAPKPSTVVIETGGLVSGFLIDIIGSAYAEDFVNYQLFYYKEFSGEWITICEDDSEVLDDVLCSWNMEGVLSGEYLLKLAVTSDSDVSEEYAYVNFRNQLITSPESIYGRDAGYVIYRQQKDIIIEGVALLSDFDYYTIELCKLDGVCISDGIELVNNGLEPTQGVLGSLDLLSVTESGFYLLTLKVFDSEWGVYETSNKIYIETQMQDGWPQALEVQGDGGWALSFMNQPTIVDLDFDGFENLVIAYDLFISVFNEEGEFMDNWPFEINTTCYDDQQRAIMQTGPAVGDVDGDGDLEIVIGDNCGYLHVLNHDATYLDGWPKKIYLTGWKSPSLADVDADGLLDIIVVGGANWKVVDFNGDYLPGWPKWLESNLNYSYFYSSDYSAATANFDDDEMIELVLTAKGLNTNQWIQEDILTRVFLVDDDGTIMSGWPQEFLNGGASEPTIADVDNDDEFEILISSSYGSLYAWNIDGSLVDGWPINIIGGYYTTQPVVVDLDYDGVLEVIATSDSCVYAFELSGEEKEGFPVCREYGYIYSDFGGLPSVGNLDIDVEQEFFGSYGGGWSSYDLGSMIPIYGVNHDGSIISGFPKYLSEIRLGELAPIVDLDKDGDNELLMYSWDGLIQVFDLGGLSGHDDWPEFYNGETHTSQYERKTPPSNKPKSQIINQNNYSPILGTVYMALERLSEDGFWKLYAVIIDDGKFRTINKDEYLALDYLWNDRAVSVSKSGTYRVVAEFRDKQGKSIQTTTGFLKNSWEFIVT